jgi:hypothetical protein
MSNRVIVCIYTCVFICYVCACLRVCVCICMYIYIYIYIYDLMLMLRIAHVGYTVHMCVGVCARVCRCQIVITWADLRLVL